MLTVPQGEGGETNREPHLARRESTSMGKGKEGGGGTRRKQGRAKVHDISVAIHTRHKMKICNVFLSTHINNT